MLFGTESGDIILNPGKGGVRISSAHKRPASDSEKKKLNACTCVAIGRNLAVAWQSEAINGFKHSPDFRKGG